MSDLLNDDLAQDDLVALFVPKLVLLLAHAENEKGEALNEEEVLSIRDNSSVVMVPVDVAKEMDASRGADINPENVWQEWQRLRAELKETTHRA